MFCTTLLCFIYEVKKTLEGDVIIGARLEKLIKKKKSSYFSWPRHYIKKVQATLAYHQSILGGPQVTALKKKRKIARHWAMTVKQGKQLTLETGYSMFQLL